ncbi:hypothetical protein D3C75_785010 [compost metagenome]
MINIGRQIVGKRARYRHQTVADMLQLAVNGHQKLMLCAALFDDTIQNQLAFIAGMQRLNEGNVRIYLFHGQPGNRMMCMDQIILLVHPQLRPPDIIAVGLNIFLHNRTISVQCPVKCIKDNLFASLAPNPLGQPE